jgi:hypothetical protein
MNDHYKDLSTRIDTILGADSEKWLAITAAKAHFDQLSPEISFYQWIADNYGIKLCLDQDGHLQLDYTIINEQKHTLFYLKYGGKHP